MIRCGDITGFDDAEVIERGNYEQQDIRCTEMGSTDTSSGGGNLILRNSADMGTSIRRGDSRHYNGD